MKVFTNLLTGFVISFAGSFPMGYLNLLGLSLYTVQGPGAFLFFLAGIISVEIVIVFATLKGAVWLSSQHKLIFWMELLSVTLLVAFAAFFYFHQNKSITTETPVQFSNHPYILGLTLSALNFFQVPFWTGWNLILVETKRIVTENKLVYFYVLGTAWGTLCGMSALVFGVHYVLTRATGFTFWLEKLIPAAFLVAAFFHSYKLVQKYSLKKRQQTPNLT